MRVSLFVVGLFMFAFTALAAEEASTTPQVAEGAPGWMSAATPIVLALIGALFGWLRMRQQKGEEKSQKSEEEKEAERKALQDLQAAVANTYLSYVSGAKEDGKFDGAIARSKALATAKKSAIPAVKAIYELWGDDKVEALIHRIANKQGADKATVAEEDKTTPEA